MDRFESTEADITAISPMLIYIPIWIDLKVGIAEKLLKIISNLHSNMDRFERCLSSDKIN